MHIIELSKKPGALLERQAKELEQNNIRVNVLNASSASFITAMRLASAIKHTEAQLVVCHSLSDVTAAVSTRSIVAKDRAAYRIVYIVDAQESVPRRIPLELTRQVALWMFPNKVTEELYTQVEDLVMNKTALYTEPLPLPEHELSADHDSETLTLSWIGDIEDTELLDKLMRAVEKVTAPLNVRVCGSGKARYVMPIVKRTRAFENRVKIIWHGDEYDRDNIISRTNLSLVTEPSMTETHLAMLSAGIVMLDMSQETDKISEQIEMLHAERAELKRLAEESKRLYSSYIDKCFHVEQLAQTLINAVQE